MGASHESNELRSAMPPRLAESTPYLLTRATRAAARLAQGHFAGESLRFPHYVALCWVEHLGPCAQRELAQAMAVDPSDLVTVVTALEDAGLLIREADRSDRRRNLLALTEQGRHWLYERHARARAYDAVLCASTTDDGEVLRDQLAALLEAQRAFRPGET